MLGIEIGVSRNLIGRKLVLFEYRTMEKETLDQECIIRKLTQYTCTSDGKIIECDPWFRYFKTCNGHTKEIPKPL